MKYIIIFSFLLIIISCEKKTAEDIPIVPDTFIPSNYYPIFPGSYWKYLRHDTDTVIDVASSSYVLNSFVCMYNSDIHSTPAYVPLLNNQPIYGYSKVEHIPAPFGNYYQLWPILSEQLNSSFESYWSDPRTGNCGVTKISWKKLTNPNGDSLLIMKGIPHCLISSPSYYYWEYIKGVGLANYYSVDTVAMDTTFYLRLFDYFVNN